MSGINYDGAVLCGHHAQALGANYRWPHRRITWGVRADLPALPRDSFRRVVATAFSRIANVCGLTFAESDEQRPNLVIVTQTEAPGGVLADCELPFPGIQPTQSLRCRVDTADAWTISDNPPNDRVDLTRVLCHEFCHGVGVSHGPAGALMAPTYSVRVREPQGWDIAELTGRYGPRVSDPPPPPADDPVGRAKLLELFRDGQKFVIKFPDGTERVL
jgi:hypothetical protein